MFTVIACFAIPGVFTKSFINSRSVKTSKGVDPDKGFAVIELFTSDCCSSYPPADEVVGRVEVASVEKESGGEPIYILAYPVNYWNRLGGKEAFNSLEYSAARNPYDEWLDLSSVYTPHIVVNGRTEFVGSNEGNQRNAVRAGRGETATAD